MLPRISDDDLVWVEMTDNTRMVAFNRWGIDELQGPPTPTPLTVWIIPALAVDADGYRPVKVVGSTTELLPSVRQTTTPW